jgi:hypothetical protein
LPFKCNLQRYISGGGLASVKDVVDLEEKIETTGSHTEWTMQRVASSSKVGLYKSNLYKSNLDYS